MSPDRPSGRMVHHWNRKKICGWYKFHATTDTETGKILAYVITEPYYGNSLASNRDRHRQGRIERGGRILTQMTDREEQSDLKKMFRDAIRAKTWERAAELIGQIVSCHNIFEKT